MNQPDSHSFTSYVDPERACTWTERGLRCTVAPIAHLGDGRSSCEKHSWQLVPKQYHYDQYGHLVVDEL